MKLHENVLFLDSVSPGVRKLLVRERCRAMRGRLADAIESLDNAINHCPPSLDGDVVAVGLLKAELFHLNRDADAALGALKSVVIPRQVRLPDSVQFVIEGNLTTAQMANFSPDGTSAFYHLVDRRRQAGYEWTDHSALLEAQRAIDAGRHAEAVAPLWRELVRSHRQGHWPTSRSAETRYAKLCLDLGELGKAAFYTVLGERDKQIPALAQAIIARRDAELVRSIVLRLITDANLRRHFVLAADLFAGIHDLIPDDQIPDVARWLLPRCEEGGDRCGGVDVVPVAWRALKKIGERVPPDLAARAVGIAVAHREWLGVAPKGKVLVDREDIVKAVTHLCHQLPVESLGPLAEQTLPLALERIQDSDYADVVNLLANIAERGGAELTKRIADALYPPGKPVNRLLAQMDRIFGKESLTTEQLAAFALKVAVETRLQVQRVQPGEEQVRLPETLMVHGRADGKGPAVTIVQGLGLAALERHRNRLSPEVLSELIRAVLNALQDPDNLPTNKKTLLTQLSGFVDRADESLRAEVFVAAESMAKGAMSNAVLHAGSVLSAWEGNPDDVRAKALVCAAVYAADNADRANRIGEMIEDAAIDPNPRIRRGAYAAAQQLPDLPADAILPLLMGLRDPEPATAVVAFAAFADRPEWKLTRPNWKLFLLAARSAADSPHTNLRWHAASAVAERAASVPSGLRREVTALLKRFESDVSAAVRRVIHLHGTSVIRPDHST